MRWIGYGDAARHLYAACLANLAPAGHVQLSFGYIWPKSSYFILKFCRTLKISGGRAFLWEWKAIHIDQIHSSYLLFRYVHSHFTIKEKHGDKIILTFPKVKIWSLMCQFSEWFSLAPGLSPLSATAHRVVVLSVALLRGKVGKGSGDWGPNPS